MELIVRYAARLVCGFLVLVTILPLFPVGYWWVRVCDFPRFHLGVFAIILVVLALVLAKFDNSTNLDDSKSVIAIEGYWITILAVAVMCWQFSHVMKYGPWWPTEVLTAEASTDTELSLVVANLEFDNEQKDAVVTQLSQFDADVLLLIEFDEAWSEAFSQLESAYPYRIGDVRGDGLGMMMWSRLPLHNPETRYLVTDERVSVHCQIELSDQTLINFIGVHPTPPGLYDDEEGERHDSRIRDAELMLVAKEIEKNPDEEWIVTGDFNDVAWSHTTRLFKRVSGLKDPRVGRGLYNTYHAEKLLMRFPIDHVFVSAGATVQSMERFHPSGSDHFGIVTHLNFELPQGTDPEPVANDPEDAEELIEQGKEDAEERDEETNEN